MAHLYSDADKIYTDVSMLDELIHNLKFILQGIILKDQQEAENNETEESIEQSDLYMAITDGTVLFSEFIYDGSIMHRMNDYIVDNDLELEPFTDEQIAEYVIDNDLIPKEYRSILLQLASNDFMSSYVELNNYYRRLNGQKDIGDADFFVDISYIPSTYYQQFIPEDELAAYDSTGKSQTQIKSEMREMAKAYLLATPITEFTSYQISLLDTTGIMDNILEDNTNLMYLKHLGAKKIDIYRARKADRFEILYMPDCESQIRKRYQDIFDTIRVMYLKRFYSSAYKFENPYYDKFFMILLICQTANDIIVEMPEYFISRTVFDARTVQTILEANGVKYFPEIPLKYQVALVRALTSLIKYKSTTKNIYDIAKVFSLKNVEVSKYYLLKKRNISSDEILPFDMNGGPVEDPLAYDKEHEMDGGWPGTGEQGEEIIVYDGGFPHKSVNFLSAADLKKMYSLYFVRVPIGDTLDNYLRNTIHHTPYDTITNNDPYWDGPYNHEYVRYQILQKDFTTQSTKYLSMTSGYSSKDYLFQIIYFLNMIMNTPADSQFLNLPVPVISQSANFNLHDLIIMLYCLSFQYFDPATDDIIDLKNRDPRPATYIDPSVTIGDYDPEEIGDWTMDGGYARTMDEYYNADGGTHITSKHRYTNLNAGGVINSVTPIDFPETMDIDFDEASTDTDFDALGVFEYLEIEEMDGGDPFSEVFDRYNDVYDGGYVKNSYLYHGENTGILADPCQYYRESNDRYKFPYMDLSDRILGFNAEANLAELQASLDDVLIAKFQYLRGYNINELVPSFTQKINMYEGKSRFPSVGIIGQLYEDTTNGKFYFWNSTGYTVVKEVYSKGIQDFMTPQDGIYYTPNDLVTIYENNKEIYDNLLDCIKECDTEEEYWILQYVFEYLFTMRWDQNYLRLPSTGKIPMRYTEFLKEKDGILYGFYEKLVSETNIDTKQYNMSTYIDQVIESIMQYLATDGLEYIFYFVPTVSLGVTLRYVSLLLNFFKSYKAYILDVSSTMRMESTLDNTMIEKDDIGYKGFFYNKGDPASLYDNYLFNISLEKDDEDLRYRLEDRAFIREHFLQEWVDLNGGDVDQDYWFDIDALDGSHYPGYSWPYTQYYILDGGGPRDAILDPEPDAVRDGVDYDPERWGDYDMDGTYPPGRIIMDNADGGGYENARPTKRGPTYIDIDGGRLEDDYAPLDSPHFTGTPTVPNVDDPNTDTDQIANTHFVQSVVSYNAPNYSRRGSANKVMINAMRHANEIMGWSEIPVDNTR